MTHILIVDRDSTFVSEVRNALTALECVVSLETEGQLGLDAAKRLKPDLILLSVELTDMNGFLVCTALKRDKALAAIPVVLTSSDDSADEVFAAHRRLRTRAADYIKKPIAIPDLLAHLAAHARLRGIKPYVEPIVEMTDQQRANLAAVIEAAQQPQWASIAGGGLMVLVAVLYIGATGIVVAQWHAAKTWSAVTAKVLHAERRYSTDDSYVVARYAYDYAGKHYESTRLSVAHYLGGVKFGHGSLEPPLCGGGLIAAYEARDTVTVYVDPTHPKDAVADRDIQMSGLWTVPLAVLVFLIPGFWTARSGLGRYAAYL